MDTVGKTTGRLHRWEDDGSTGGRGGLTMKAKFALVLSVVAIATAALEAVAVAAPAHDSGARQARAVRTAAVEMFWAADEQDLLPNSGTVLDTFDSTGK